MKGNKEDLFQVLTPPLFNYLEGLFLPDLKKARLSARLSLFCHEQRKRGYRVGFDPCGDGLGAEEKVRHLKDEGVKNVMVVGAECDKISAAILVEALNRTGFETSPASMVTTEDDRFLSMLSNRIESLSRMDLLMERSKEPLPVFMIQEKGEPVPPDGVAFRREGNRLLRTTAGQADSIPFHVEQIRFFRPDEEPEDCGEGVLHVFLMPSAHKAEQGWLSTCADLIHMVGGQRFRLAFSDASPWEGRAWGGASWAARYGIGEQPFRAFLSALVSSHLPAQRCLLNAVIGLYESGVDPMEEIYGGNALVERNAELIENIV